MEHSPHPYDATEMFEALLTSTILEPERLAEVLEQLDPKWMCDRLVETIRHLPENRYGICGPSVAGILRWIDPAPVLNLLAERIADPRQPAHHRANFLYTLQLYDPKRARAHFATLTEDSRTAIVQAQIVDALHSRDGLASIVRNLEEMSASDRREHLQRIDRVRRGVDVPALALYEGMLLSPSLRDLHAVLLSSIDVPAHGLSLLRLQHLAQTCRDPDLASLVHDRCAADAPRPRRSDVEVGAWLVECRTYWYDYIVRVATRSTEAGTTAASVRISPWRTDGRFEWTAIGPFEPYVHPDERSIPIAPGEAAALTRVALGPMVHTCTDVHTLAAAYWLDRFRDPEVTLRRDRTVGRALIAATHSVLGDTWRTRAADHTISLRPCEDGRGLSACTPDLEWDCIARPRLRERLVVPECLPRGRDLATLDLAAALHTAFREFSAVGDPLTEVEGRALDDASAVLGRVVADDLVAKDEVVVQHLSWRLDAALAQMPELRPMPHAGIRLAYSAVAFAIRACGQCHVRCLDAPAAAQPDFYASDEHPARWRAATRH